MLKWWWKIIMRRHKNFYCSLKTRERELIFGVVISFIYTIFIFCLPLPFFPVCVSICSLFSFSADDCMMGGSVSPHFFSFLFIHIVASYSIFSQFVAKKKKKYEIFIEQKKKSCGSECRCRASDQIARISHVSFQVNTSP